MAVSTRDIDQSVNGNGKQNCQSVLIFRNILAFSIYKAYIFFS
jgi:hypothetical protein